MTRPRQIVAFGGGGFSMEAGNPLLDDYVLGLASAAGRNRPRVCFLPTASGDADHYVVRFYRQFDASVARRRTSRCFAATAAWRTSGRTCSPRTSCTSAAAA
jgi:hypothetical protein